MLVLGQLSRDKLVFAELLILHPVTRWEEVRKQNAIDSEKRDSFVVGISHLAVYLRCTSPNEKRPCFPCCLPCRGQILP